MARKKKFKSVFKKLKTAKKIKTPKKLKTPKLSPSKKKAVRSLGKPKTARPRLARPARPKGVRPKLARPKKAGLKTLKGKRSVSTKLGKKGAKSASRKTATRRPSKYAESEAESGFESAVEEGGTEAEEMEAGVSGVSEQAGTSEVDEVDETETGELVLPPGVKIYAPVMFTVNPAECLCPDCDEVVTTVTSRVKGVRAWCCFFTMIFSICLLPCAFIPCICACCYDVKHFCPNCRRPLGRYHQCQCCN